MAYRLAKAGLRTCLLERGKAWPPGSFPRSPLALQDSLWDPSEGKHGFFDVWSRVYDHPVLQWMTYRPVHDAVLRALRRRPPQSLR